MRKNMLQGGGDQGNQHDYSKKVQGSKKIKKKGRAFTADGLKNKGDSRTEKGSRRVPQS